MASSTASRDLFVDTSGLYALVDKRDAHHSAAREVVAKRVRAGRKLIVTECVVDETVTLAKARDGTHVALRVLDLIEQSMAIRVEWIGSDRFAATKAFFLRHADPGYSFTDCTSFVLMRELRIKQALTSDGHFPEAGFEASLPVR
ncbi:MAG TPA: PIN domain-containing protein [Gammaproteobacteria bacterium]|nr:PIN domain-containing protein [Gammaproteobacteria bacterium]